VVGNACGISKECMRWGYRLLRTVQDQGDEPWHDAIHRNGTICTPTKTSQELRNWEESFLTGGVQADRLISLP
jgi:alkylated DNA nucleotide flippase Atl1